MPQIGWIFDVSKCTGCQACINACKFENNTTLDFTVNYRWFVRRESGTYPAPKVEFFTLACNHCDEPACLAACPVGAIEKRASDGIVLIDQGKCIGCEYCVWACPYGVPQVNEVAHKVEKCTFCVHRIEQGLRPACVDTCVGGAIQLGYDVQRNGEPPVGFADPALTGPSIEFRR
jgi:Fe-S-cluster-containing dehydrogenase component